MTFFSELLSKISEISNEYIHKFNEDLEEAIQCFDKFEEEIQNGKKVRDKVQKKNAVVILQSIHEDDDNTITKTTENTNKNEEGNSSENTEKRGSKKRSKEEVDDMFSPEQEKRQKRNASVKAQSVISKQGKDQSEPLNESIVFLTSENRVNVNLTQKLRREDDNAKAKGRRAKDEDKENTEPSLIQIKQEKISLPPEPELDSLPLNIEIKQEVNNDQMAMPPPTAPVPKPRKAPKDKTEDHSEEEAPEGRRSTRRRATKNTEAPPTRQSSRVKRASSRAGKATEPEEQPPAETRPKRTRAKRAVADSSTTDNDKETQENIISSPAEKPRPKRTRKGQKAIEKQTDKPIETEPKEPETNHTIISPKEEKLSQPPTPVSPILPNVKKTAKRNKGNVDGINKIDKVDGTLDATKVINQQLDSTVTIANHLDATVVLPNGLYNHAPVTPKALPQMNETVVLESNRETIVLEQQQKAAIMDTTVVIDKGDTKAPNVTEDNSLLTDDDSIKEHNTQLTPPKQQPPQTQPLSAVKEKVQQFEEMATRQTRTKTRAMAKKEDPADNHTPPDKVSKAILSSETLSMMNNMIFNSKQPHISSSTSKLRDLGTKQLKSHIPSSTSKLNRSKDSVEEQRREKEDARKKKEALLEAKKEMQKKKREEKMAAAAAARSAAERERRAQLEAAARERQEKMAHADAGRQERLKEAEKKKLELARKAAETEERRRADDAARQQRANEQRRAEEARRQQLHEAEALKKEAALMNKEIERRQREFLEKQKLKQKMEGNKMLTPLKTPGTPGGLPIPPIEPVYMADGFEYLNSDEEEDTEENRPIPAWSTSKVWKQRMLVQTRVPTAAVDRLFSVREHSPDLREIFPAIERARLKRTSSAVWRTPPARLPALHE